MFRSLERTMVDLDPPDHTRLRQFVHKAFTPGLIEQMRDRAQTLANDLLDAVALNGEMDLVRDYALLGRADWRLRETDLNLSDVDGDAQAVTFADQRWKIRGRFAQDHFLA